VVCGILPAPWCAGYFPHRDAGNLPGKVKVYFLKVRSLSLFKCRA
jgi:hypothetical protein